MSRTASDRRHARARDLCGRIRACRRCHLAGFLDEAESVPLAWEPDADAPPPRILLVGQAPSLRGGRERRPFAGVAGDKLRAWFAAGGIAPEDFWRKIHLTSVTKCYPGRLPGARGDRVPTPEEQALCRPWLDEQLGLFRPEVVLLVGLLSIRTFLGRTRSLTDAVGTSVVRDGVRYLPLPHPSGVSRWLNEPDNVAAVARAMATLRGWVDELGL